MQRVRQREESAQSMTVVTNQIMPSLLVYANQRSSSYVVRQFVYKVTSIIQRRKKCLVSVYMLCYNTKVSRFGMYTML